MTKKTKNKLDQIADAVDVSASLIGGYIKNRYEIEKRIDDLKEKTEAKTEEIKKEAIQSAYEIKKGFVRAVVELILLSTGLTALIVGLLILIHHYVPLEIVLIGYGLAVTIIVLLQMKLR